MAKSPTRVAAEKAPDQLPATDSGFEEFAGAGLNNVGSDDILIPRLGIIQALSPQLKKTKSEYIPGAEEGIICDLGTAELFPDGIWFLPVYYRKDYLEWAPRESGEGLVEVHSSPTIMDQTSRNDANQVVLPNGNVVQETAQFYGINLTAGGRLSFIPMASTQIKKARRWNTLATGEKLRRSDGSEFVAPLFYRTYFLTSAEEGNNKGDWYGWVLNRGKALPEISLEEDGFDWRQLKGQATSFLDSLVKGEVKGDVASMAEDSSQTEEAM